MPSAMREPMPAWTPDAARRAAARRVVGCQCMVMVVCVVLGSEKY